MATLTIGGSSNSQFPVNFAAPTVETKADWSDDWTLKPELTAVSWGIHFGASHSTCELTRQYGRVKMPYEADFPSTDRTALDLSGHWVRVKIAGDNGMITAFIGHIENNSTELLGTDPVPSGIQTWLAFGGAKILNKITIASAYFLNADATTSHVEWLPPMNKRDRHGMVVGNQAAGSAQLYGGPDLWSHYDYLQYLLTKFVQQPDGPTWTIGGQAQGILDKMTTTIDFPAAPNMLQMLEQLIPKKYGIDYAILPTDAGFEITIFALSARSSDFAGATMPRNPNKITIDRSDISIADIKLVESDEERYDKIQVVGKRIVVCGTLLGAQQETDETEQLTPKWSAGLELKYWQANGLMADENTPIDAVEKERRQDKYRDVYAKFGAPDNWDFAGGAWQVYCGDDGTVKQGGAGQNLIRETLNWIPLKEGFDYTQDPPVDNTNPDVDVEPDYKHPLAFILNEVPDSQTAPIWEQCDQVGMHVSHPFKDWGVQVEAHPQEKLALNHLPAAANDDDDDDEDEEDEEDDDDLGFTAPTGIQDISTLDVLQYDHENLVATFAMESDHRIRLVYDISGTDGAAGDGSVKTIVDNEAELWVVLADTKIGITTRPPSEGSPEDGIGTSLASTGDKMRVLRNDVSRLALIMAGELARYSNERSRATIKYMGLKPIGGQLGGIVEAIQQGDTRRSFDTPVTSIEWSMPRGENGTVPAMPHTIVKVGYA